MFPIYADTLLGAINIAAANAANAAASAAADVMGSPAALKAVKILGRMISLPSSFAFFHDLISLPGCKANFNTLALARCFQ
jgi:hypothetical protein